MKLLAYLSLEVFEVFFFFFNCRLYFVDLIEQCWRAIIVKNALQGSFRRNGWFGNFKRRVM